MDLASYAHHAIALANLEPYGDPGDDALVAFAAEAFPACELPLSARDVDVLRDCHRGFRAVMLADSAEEAAARMNAVMGRHPICPEITDHPHPDAERQWHLHLVGGDDQAQQMAGSMAMGLMNELLEVGLARRGSCCHATCEDVYLDVSPGGTRRYCSDTCQNRANVAAYRARKRAAASADGGIAEG